MPGSTVRIQAFLSSELHSSQDNIPTLNSSQKKLILTQDFEVITSTEDISSSGYVSRGGKALAAKCMGIEARPTGNDTYPPTVTSGWPSG